MKIVTTKQFLKDLKRQKKRNKEIKKLKAIVSKLSQSKKLAVLNRDHKLTGEHSDFSECHIEPDWLLIYKKTNESLSLVRTGTHADLF